jgi:trigger factor
MTEPALGHEATHSREGVRHTLQIIVPSEKMEERVHQVAQAFRAHARIQGFRRGKAPLAMVRRQYHDEIRQRVLDDTLPEYLGMELEARKLDPLDSPELTGVEFEPGGPLTFSVQFDTAPEVNVGELDFRATRPKVEVTDEMIEEALGELRERFAGLEPAEDGAPVAEGLYARCEISLFPRDGKGKRLAEENRFVHVGEERALPGLNDELPGMAVGDSKEFVTQVADGYPNDLVAGKEVLCRVKVEELKARKMPEVDDDFAADLGADDLATLRERLRDDIAADLEQRSDRKVESDLLEQLRLANPVEVPASLIEKRLDEMVRRLATDLSQQGIDPRGALDWNRFREENRSGAEASLAEEMLLDKIAEDHGVEVDDEAVQAEITRQWEAREGGKTRPATSVIQQMRKDGSFDGLRLSMQRRSALDHLKAHATIELDGGDGASEQAASE